jgi:hypothetical protein
MGASLVALAGYLMPVDFGLTAAVAAVGLAGFAFYRDRMAEVEASVIRRLQRLLQLIEDLA